VVAAAEDYLAMADSASSTGKKLAMPLISQGKKAAVRDERFGTAHRLQEGHGHLKPTAGLPLNRSWHPGDPADQRY